jgi:hypothetical protein
MNLGVQIDNESIWMSFWRRHRTQVAIREDLIRRDRNRFYEEQDDERHRIAVAEDHALIMKKVQARNAALDQQAAADRRAEQEALSAWRAGSDARRER